MHGNKSNVFCNYSQVIHQNLFKSEWIKSDIINDLVSFYILQRQWISSYTIFLMMYQHVLLWKKRKLISKCFTRDTIIRIHLLMLWRQEEEMRWVEIWAERQQKWETNTNINSKISGGTNTAQQFCCVYLDWKVIIL